MDIQIEWVDGKWPSFNISLASSANADPFLVIKGCRIAEGQKGEFLSGPSTKNQATGKYWNHCYFNEGFSEAVLKKAKAAKPVESPRKKNDDAARSRQLDADSDIPF